MAQTHFLPLPNKDLISSFAFNFYGSRLAASSLDHHIYVLSSNPDTGEWPQDLSHQDREDEPVKNQKPKNGPNLQSWTAHDGPVVKVVWSDPLHGEILASAGTDGTVRIWEEDTKQFISSTYSSSEKTPNESAGLKLSKSPSSISPGGWYQRSILADSNGIVRDINFSPSETTLKLASISTDNHLRLYECLETNCLSADNWNLIINIDLSSLPMNICSLTDHMNPSMAGFQQHPSFTSVRGFDPTNSLNNPKHGSSTNFNLMNPLSGLRSSATSTISSLNALSGVSTTNPAECSGGWALSWCPETYWGDLLAVSCGSSDSIRIFKFSPHSQWENFAILSPSMSSRSIAADSEYSISPNGNTQLPPISIAPITSLAWAPPCGRNYHLLAAGHRDGRARIWKLTPPELGLVTSSTYANWEVEMDTELDEHVIKNTSHDKNTSSTVTGGVGKCDWNVTGTVLSTSGSDGKVRIWKMGYTSRWVNTGEISCTDEDTEVRGQAIVSG